MSLDIKRKALQDAILVLDPSDDDQGKTAATAAIQRDWEKAKGLIEDWWGAYKAWEGTDTFNQAVADHRMTMRSWDGDKASFDDLVNKTGPSNIADEKRFYASSSDRQPAARRTDGMTHQDKFAAIANPTPPQGTFGWSAKNPKPEVVYGRPVRGINASAFMTPANFATRKQKYKLGLHDTSVKLLIPDLRLNPDNLSFKEQSHNQAAKRAYFCFLPISKPEDQYVIYKLIRYAEKLEKEGFPALDTLIRTYRSEMTRVKLANGYDMGTGYIAVPTDDDKIPYKVSYSIGSYVKERGEDDKTGIAGIKVDSELIRKREQAYFKENADVVRLGNELVIAMRKHANPQFPVYAVFEANNYKCFTIGADGKTMVSSTNEISAQGVANF